MALQQYNVTLGSGATQLSATRRGIRNAIIHNIAGNGTLYVGTSAVTSSAYGFSLAADSKQALGPFSGDAPVNTTDLYFSGTQNNVVHVLVITH